MNSRSVVLALVAIILPIGMLYGQFGWIEYTIEDSYTGAISIFPVDLDGDSDCDVVAAAYSLGDITWWESNLTGIGENGHGELRPSQDSPTIVYGYVSLPRYANCRFIDITGRTIGNEVRQPGIMTKWVWATRPL